MAHKTSTRREGTDVGLFHERTQAERATAELKQEGFKDNQIGVLMQDRESQKDLAGSTGTKVSDAATSGAIGGGVGGGILGLLAGVGALAIPGVGPIIAGGALAGRTSGGEDQQRLQLREEELRAEKERVQAGEVRVHKEVVKEKKTIDVPVTREEVVVERHPVSGREASDRDIGDDEEIRIPVMEEEVRVEKTPVVKEEVSLKKRTVADTKKVSDTVKREEAHVEETGDAHVRTRSEAEEAWRGSERRYHHDSQYMGPERRAAGV